MSRKGHEFGGFDKEPPQPHGPRLQGKQPIVHSHSKGRIRKITAGKKQNKKNSL
jgi:hypothetical protein